MKKIILGLLSIILLVGVVFAFLLTRDGELQTPDGEGTIAIDGTEFEAFPLPNYAAEFVDSDYKSYFVEVAPGIKIHVLETGSGYPVYMQHGNPTSGFLYRKVAAKLPKDRFRMIMPTMVGLGFSTKIPASEHTLENHMTWINGLLGKLAVNELIYVGQDWGGPAGMGALARSPGLLKGAVLMNTGFDAPTEQRDLSTAHATVKTPIVGEFMMEGLVSIFDRLPDVQGDPESMPAAVTALYGKPVLDSGNAKGPLALMRMVPDGPDHPSAEQMKEIEGYVKTLDIPAEIIWGMNDPILAQGLPAMQKNFPNAPVLETEAGHFLQEEVPEEIAAAIMRLHEQIDGSSD